MRECVFETYRRSSAVIELCAEEESARSCSVLCAQPRAAGALGRSGATSVRLVCTGAKRGIALILRSLDALCVAFRASLVARSAAPLWPLEQTARAGQIRHAVIWHGSSGQIRHAVVYYTGGTVRVHEWHLPLRPGGRREVACGALHVAKTIHERHTLCRESLCVKLGTRVNLAPSPRVAFSHLCSSEFVLAIVVKPSNEIFLQNFVRCMSKVVFFPTVVLIFKCPTLRSRILASSDRDSGTTSKRNAVACCCSTRPPGAASARRLPGRRLPRPAVICAAGAAPLACAWQAPAATHAASSRVHRQVAAPH